jgi:hypothetical protein
MLHVRYCSAVFPSCGRLDSSVVLGLAEMLPDVGLGQVLDELPLLPASPRFMKRSSSAKGWWSISQPRILWSSVTVNASSFATEVKDNQSPLLYALVRRGTWDGRYL